MKNVAQTLRKASRGKPNEKQFIFPLPDQLIGVEVEIDYPERLEDGNHFKWPENFAPYWNKTRDGSLRNGHEYVLAAPLAGNMLSNAICQLFTNGTSVYRTTTGSTHIHVDMLEDDTPIASVQVLVLLMFMLEPAVFAACDPGREWCGYTNKLSSAPDALLGSILNCDLSESADNFMDAIAGHTAIGIGRYYGLNLQALSKYGSVEFRYFPTATNAEELASWVVLTQMFKKAAIEVGSVAQLQEIIHDESRYNDFISSYFGQWQDTFMKEVPHYKAIASFQKALATAASQQYRTKDNLSDDFDSRAVTESKMYSKLIKKRKKEANTRAALEMLVKQDPDSITPTAMREGPLLISQGHIFMPAARTGRDPTIAWANLSIYNAAQLASRGLSVDYLRRVLELLASTNYSILQRVPPSAHQRTMISYSHAITVIRQAIAITASQPAPEPPAPARITVDFNELVDRYAGFGADMSNSLAAQAETLVRGSWTTYTTGTPAEGDDE